MIRYDLTCDHGHAFDAWFRDSDAFDDQKRKGVLSCPVCGSAEVEKALMAPAVSKGGETLSPDAREKVVREMLRTLRKHVVDNAEYVGSRFPEEARRIHYEEVERKGIYGEATAEEVKTLFEEGIAVLPVPDAPDDRN